MSNLIRPALCAGFMVVAAALGAQAPVVAAPRAKPAIPAARAKPPQAAPTDRFIVAFKDDALEQRNPVARRHLLDAHGRKLGLRINAGRRLANGADVIRTDRKLDAASAKKLLLALHNDPRVAYVEIDRVHTPRRLPDDPLLPQQPQLFRDIGGHGFDFAWERGTGEGVVVAVIDSGIVAHEDLDANVVAGYDFLGNDTDPTDDPSGCPVSHGTEVAGVIAAVGDNAIGIAGAAHAASIQPIRVMSGCDGATTSDVADAIIWAAGGAVDGVPANATPAQVINLSFATYGSCGPTLQAAIDSANAAGAVVVAATGDDYMFDVSMLAPASCDGVILVANGSHHTSQGGPTDTGDITDVAATSLGMPFTERFDQLGKDGVLTTAVGDTYEHREGSSYSTAFASAAVALMQSVRPHAPADVEALLRATAEPGRLVLWERGLGAGFIDADAATLAAGTPTLVLRGWQFRHEGDADTSADLTVTLSAPLTTPVTFTAQTVAGDAVAGTDYVALPPTQYTLAPGETSKVIPLTIIGDEIAEGRERFHVEVTNVVGAADKTRRVDLVIEDDEAQRLEDDVTSFPTTVDSPDGTSKLYFMDIPAGAYWAMTQLTVLAGDPDVYVRRDAIPTTTQYDCASTTTGDEGCPLDNFEGAAGGRYYVLVHSVSGAFEGSLTASWDEGDVLTVADAWQTEGQPSIVFTVTRQSPGTTSASAQVYVEHGTTGYGDISFEGADINLPPGVMSKTIEIPLLDDAAVEGDETFTLRLISSQAPDPFAATGTIHDNDGPTLVVEDAEVVEGDSGTQTVQVTVALTAPVAETVSFLLTTRDGTATSTAGNDYIAFGVMGSIPEGETEATFDVAVRGDTVVEREESFYVEISDVSGAPVQDPQGEVVIEASDLPTLSLADVSVSEGDAGLKVATFTVQLSQAAPFPVHYEIGTAEEGGTATPGVDYRAQWLDEAIPAGMLAKTFNVAIQGDTAIEPNEAFLVEVESEDALVPDAIAQGTIADDDLPALTVADVRVLEGSTGPKAMVFTVQLDRPAPLPVTFTARTTPDGTATAGVDYAAINRAGQVIPAGQAAKTFTIVMDGDTVAEPHETLAFVVKNATNVRVVDGAALGTIQNDDDLPTLSIGDVAIAEGNSGTKQALFTVTLSHATPAAVSFNAATSGGTASAGSDYAALDLAGVTIAAGQTSKALAVVVNGDTTIEANETYVVALANIVGAAVLDGSALGTITNDDKPSLTIGDVAVVEGNSGTRTATFTVALSTAAPYAVTFDATTTGAGSATAGVDYTALNFTGLSIPAGQLTKTFTVTLAGDTTIEANETYVVAVGNVVGTNVLDGTALGTITNDDKPTLSIGDVVVSEGHSGQKQALFTVTLSASAPYPITFNAATTGAGSATAGVDYVALNATGLNVPAGQLSKLVAVVLNGDTTVEANETFVVAISAPNGATLADGAALGTISNDD
jgi:hypothetical protein